MGIMDSVKKAVRGRSGKVADAIDTAVDKVDERTKGKYRDKLESGADKVKETVTKLDPETERPSTIDGPAAAGTSSPGQSGKGSDPGSGPVTGTPPPTGPDASNGPRSTSPATPRPSTDPTAPTTSRPGNDQRRRTG